MYLLILFWMLLAGPVMQEGPYEMYVVTSEGEFVKDYQVHCLDKHFTVKDGKETHFSGNYMNKNLTWVQSDHIKNMKFNEAAYINDNKIEGAWTSGLHKGTWVLHKKELK